MKVLLPLILFLTIANTIFLAIRTIVLDIVNIIHNRYISFLSPRGRGAGGEVPDYQALMRALF